MGQSIGAGACLAIGAVISFLVSVAKRWAWVCLHPKLVAFVVCVVVGVASVYIAALLKVHSVMSDVDFSTIASCVLVQFTSAIATHEVITQPIAKNLIGPPDIVR